MVGEGARAKTWPGSARGLAGRIRRSATSLRKVGIKISHSREGNNRSRTIHISAVVENTGMRSSAPSANGPSSNGRKEFATPTTQTVVSEGGWVEEDRPGRNTSVCGRSVTDNGADASICQQSDSFESAGAVVAVRESETLDLLKQYLDAEVITEEPEGVRISAGSLLRNGQLSAMPAGKTGGGIMAIDGSVLSAHPPPSSRNVGKATSEAYGGSRVS